ncbi:MAG: hypothetical protein Q8M16_03795 [Pirellulaceae bacterium]|nr:hypothetical protein [Pirellulaceae bacterium]
MSQFSLADSCSRLRLFRNTIVALSCGLLLLLCDGLASRAVGQERVEKQIAALSEKLERETQEMKRHYSELVEAGRQDEAEATKRALSEFQQAVETKIRELKSRIASANDQQARQNGEETAPKRNQAERKRRTEAQQNRPAPEREQREARTPGNNPTPEPERHLRELHEQLTIAIKQRQPDRVLELSHQIANHLREPQMHEQRQRERNTQERPRDERPRDDGPRHDGPRHDGPGVANEMRMMMEQLRGELQQLRRELEELRRERR